jgi:hypothetical protein
MATFECLMEIVASNVPSYCQRIYVGAKTETPFSNTVNCVGRNARNTRKATHELIIEAVESIINKHKLNHTENQTNYIVYTLAKTAFPYQQLVGRAHVGNLFPTSC